MQQETENVNNQVSEEVKKEKAFPESSQDGYRMSGTKMRSAPIDRSCPSPYTRRLMRFVALREQQHLKSLSYTDLSMVIMIITSVRNEMNSLECRSRNQVSSGIEHTSRISVSSIGGMKIVTAQSKYSSRLQAVVREIITSWKQIFHEALQIGAKRSGWGRKCRAFGKHRTYRI